MKWAPLLIAVVLGAPAAAFHVHKKLPRFAAVLGGFAVVFLVAGTPPLLAWVGHPLSPGLVMLIAVATAAVSLVFIALDFFVKGHVKKPLLGKQGKAHHWRTQYATAALAVAVLMIAANWGSVWHGVGRGFSQTWSSVVSHKPGS